MSNDELLAEVLVEVNRMRAPAEPLAELPQGTREDFWNDPLARALSTLSERAEVCEAHVSWFGLSPDGERVYLRGRELPMVCQEFVRRFDLGRLPLLVDLEAPVRHAGLVA